MPALLAALLILGLLATPGMAQEEGGDPGAAGVPATAVPEGAGTGEADAPEGPSGEEAPDGEQAPLEAPPEAPDGETDLLQEGLQAQQVADEIKISGLSTPTAIEVIPGGRVYVAEKSGRIRTFSSLDGGGAATAVTLQRVATHGDWGLTGLAYHNNFLYVSYNYIDNLATYPADSFACRGGRDGRTDAQITGCPVSGRISRFPVNTGGSLGPEQVVLDGRSRFCFQFTSHGMNDLEVGPDGWIYSSIGEGANFNLADWGQFGGNPCNDPAGQGGALRSQIDGTLGGKVYRFNPSNPAGSIQVLAKGLRNPFRITFLGGNIFTTDTGWFRYEEINRIVPGGPVENFGWPCFEGPERAEQYRDANLPICTDLYATGNDTKPIYSYPHGGTRAAISAIGARDGILYYADYIRGFIAAINPDGSGNTTVRTGVRVADIKLVNHGAYTGQLVYLDIVAGHAAILGDGPTPPPPPPPVSTATVTIQAPSYQPGDTVPFRVDHDFRADVSFSWQITRLTGCSTPGPSCTRTPVPFSGQGQQNGSFTAPTGGPPAFVEVTATVTSPTGQSASDTKRIARALPPPVPGAEVSRVFGENRVLTAVEISRRSYGPGVPVVYIARSDDFPDPLAAGPLAARTGGPILLTERGSLPAATRSELSRLRPGRVVVVGGEVAISAGVFNAIRADHPNTSRLQGADRFATAAAIANQVGSVSTIYVATGRAFPDALIGGWAAGLRDGAVLLTERDTLPPATIGAIGSLQPDRVVLVGGPLAVSESVRAQLNNLAPTTRVQGPDRYQTAAAVSRSVLTGGVGRGYLATGAAFPDALTIAPTAINEGASLLLTEPATLHPAAFTELQRVAPGQIVIVGGPAAVSTRVENILKGTALP